MKAFSSFLSTSLLVGLFLITGLSAVAQAPAWQSARVVATAAVAFAAGNYSEVNATAVDAAGNVYVAGSFQNTVVLGGTTLTSVGSKDVFVAKFSPASNQFVWALRAGGTLADQANALAVSGTSVYVAGTFSSATAGFGTTTLTNGGTVFSDAFVTKLTDAGSTGSFVWAQRAGSTSLDVATALAVSGTSVYVAGSFLNFPATFGSITLASLGSGDGFVAKLTDAGSTGSFVWAQGIGGGGLDEAKALAVSGTNIYVTGYFSGTASFGSASLAAVGSYDVFVAKLTDAGNSASYVWAQRAGGTGQEEARALVVNGSSVYVAGYFDGPTASFAGTTLTNVNSSTNDAFVAKLTDAGSTASFAWARQAGGTGRDYANALAVSGSSVLMAGYYRGSSSATFGTITLANTGTSNVFLAKLTDAGSFVWVQRAGGTDEDQANALVVSNTNVYVAGYFNSLSPSYGTTTLTNPTPSSFLGFLASLTDPTLTATAPGRALVPFQLFPNPAHGTATLRLSVSTIPAPLTLSDAQGRTVRRYAAPLRGEAVLDLDGLPAGLYLLRGAGLAQRLAVE